MYDWLCRLFRFCLPSKQRLAVGVGELAMEQLKELQQKNSLLMKLSGHVPSASSGFVDTLLVMFRVLGAETLQHLKNLKTLLPLSLGFGRVRFRHHSCLVVDCGSFY